MIHYRNGIGRHGGNKVFSVKSDLVLESGAVIPEVTVAYEQYGTLNRQKSNAILICHALSGDAHAAGKHEGEERSGWWDSVIGPGKAFDTDRYCVICSNIIGWLPRVQPGRPRRAPKPVNRMVYHFLLLP